MKYLLLLLLSVAGLGAIGQNHITVINGNDAGPGSLRQAIRDARDGDVINFRNVKKVVLTSGQLVFSKNLTIEGAGITIKGDSGPLIKTDNAKQIVLKQLSFWEDNKKPLGAILNLSSGLLLTCCQILMPVTTRNVFVLKKEIISATNQQGLWYPGSTGSQDLPMVSDPGDQTGGGPCETHRWYQDLDGDGKGNPNVFQDVCTADPAPAGYVLNDDDDDDDDTTPAGSILYVNLGVVGGNNDGSSWANAYIHLQDALANSSASVTQIWVAKGKYYPDEGGGKTDNDIQAAFSLKKNLGIYGGFAGTETSLGQRNWRINQTVLSGDIDQNDGSGFTNHDNNAVHVIYNNGLDNTAIIDGFVITGGNGDNAQGTAPVGGGMYNVNSPVGINNCTISGNSATDGGGIFNASSSISMSNCAFLNNSAGATGGAMFNSQSGPALVSCEFFGNSGGEGGAIFNSDGGGVYLVNCTLSGNAASDGGGLYCVEGGSATVINSIFWGNSSEIVFTSGFFGSPVAVSHSIVKGGFPGTGNLDVDPLFVNQANGDLHLTGCSPAIDAGDDASNDRATDLDGNPRMIDAKAGGAKIDMGAFEYQGTLPSATISGNATVCLASSPLPTVTFAASGGIAPYIFSYTINDDPTVLGAIGLSGTATVEVQTTLPGSFTYKLVGVADQSIGTCFQIAANPSVTVTVNPLPSAVIGIGTSVCKDGNASINFTGSGGTAPYTFTYTIFDGSTTTGPFTVRSDMLPLSAPTGTPGNYTYNLTNVSDASAAGCSRSISGQSATIIVNPSPDATITTGSPVTAASSANVASVPDAGLGSTYSWTISNGAITGGLGTNSILYQAGNSGSVILNVSVKSGAGCGPVSGSVNVPITKLPCPNPAISVASSVCSASTGNKASVASVAGATYVWSITNGTITAGSGTAQITFTAGASKYADYDDDDYVKLSVNVTNASGICMEPSGTYKIFISPIPSATISTPSTVCSKSTNNYVSVGFAGTGAVYLWTITNGTITLGAGTRSVWYTAGTSGSVTLAVTVTNSKGCSASSGIKSVTIASLPVANITAPASACGGSSGNTASVTNGGTGTKYCWSVSNGCINSGGSGNVVTYTAGSSGSVTVSVTVTNSSGCRTYSGNKLVTISSTPNATITASSVACAGSTGNTASVPSAGSFASYQWTVTGGTITSGSGTNSVKFTAGSSGYVTLNVTVTNSNGCKKSGSKKITIGANVIPTFAQIGPLCKGSRAPSLPTKSTNGISGSWSPSSISTGTATTTTYTFTPSAGQCASTVKMQIKVQSCISSEAKSAVTEEVKGGVKAFDVKMLPNPTHSQFTLIIQGTQKGPAEIRVYDILGRNVDRLRANTGESVNFGNGYINGIYLVEVVQGTERKVLKAIKQ